jgi:hypothetical protein
MSNQAQQGATAPDVEEPKTVVKRFADGSQMAVDQSPVASPFAALATLDVSRAEVEDSPVDTPPESAEVEANAPATPAESERTPEENAKLIAEIRELTALPTTDGVEQAPPAAPKKKSSRSGRGERSSKNDRPHAPQFGGGIRKIVLVPVAVKESAEPPRGSIGLRRFLKFNFPGQLTGLAREIVEKGSTPDVVVWSKSNSGFNELRIEVVIVEGENKEGKPVLLPNLTITKANGKFEVLAQYIGQEFWYAEVMGFPDKDGKARQIRDEKRAFRTKALNDVLIEANQRFDDAEARKNARSAPQPAAKQ